MDNVINPGKASTIDARMKLVNARIVNVENDCYFGPQVSLVIHKGKIVAMFKAPHKKRVVFKRPGTALISRGQSRSRGVDGKGQ